MDLHLGKRGKDNVTGFEGVIVGYTEHLHGCAHLGIQSSTLKDGKPAEAEWFDVQRIEIGERALPYTHVPSAFALGNIVKDKHSVFRGMVSAISYNLFNDPDIAVQPKKLKDGIPARSVFITEKRLQLLVPTKVEVSKDAPQAPPGGPADNVLNATRRPTVPEKSGRGFTLFETLIIPVIIVMIVVFVYKLLGHFDLLPL